MNKNVICLLWSSLLKKGIMPILGGLILLVAFLFFVFWFGETKRKQLITAYQAPQAFLDDILSKGGGAVSAIMKNNERVVCAIDGYGRVDSLSALNDRQKLSLPKDNLPSEDLAWYLIFFTNDSVSRIYLIDDVKLAGNVDGPGKECVDREGQFFVLKKEFNGEIAYVLNISQRRK